MFLKSVLLKIGELDPVLVDIDRVYSVDAYNSYKLRGEEFNHLRFTKVEPDHCCWEDKQTLWFDAVVVYLGNIYSEVSCLAQLQYEFTDNRVMRVVMMESPESIDMGYMIVDLYPEAEILARGDIPRSEKSNYDGYYQHFKILV